ncbi:MAG: C4-type zinc ribbon domain-containing protein [Myxococcota bacterium]
MRDKLLALAALQKVDLDIAALQKNAEAYPREIAELEKQLAQAKAAVDAERTKLDEIEKQKLNLEHTISDDKDKVRKWEARLTEQRSTREYSALAREIDIAKKGQQTMSEEIVELGKQATIQREAVKQKDAEFQAKTKDLVEKIAQLKGKLKDVEAQIAGIDGTRAEAAKQVEASLLKRYDTIRKKRLPAVVPAVAPGTCTGCRMNIRPQLYNQLVASRGLDVCPSCSRMVYAAEALEATTPK